MKPTHRLATPAALLVAALAIACNKPVVTPPDANNTAVDSGPFDSGPTLDAGTDAGTDAGSTLPVVSITSPTAGQLLTDGTPTITVSVTSGIATSVTVTLTFGSQSTEIAATEGTSGSWTATPATALASGNYSATATGANTNGAGTASASVAFIVDTHTLTAPTILSPTSGEVVTSLKPLITVSSGGQTPSVTVTITDHSGTPISLTATNNGDRTFSATPTANLAVGSASITATASDSLGETSSPSAATAFIVDPNAPTVSITSPTDQQIVATTTPTFTVSVLTGTAAAVTVAVTDGTGAADNLTATVNGDGTWSATPTTALAPGTVSLTAFATDAAGNSGGISEAVTFIVDPNVPAVSVTSPTAGQVLTNATPTFDVLVSSSTVVSVTIDVVDSAGTSSHLTGTSGSNGEWSATTALAAGAATVYASATDSLDVTTSSTVVDFVVDLTAPAAPTIVSPTGGQLVTTVTPAITFAAPSPAASVAVSATDTSGVPVVINATANGDGTWKATPASPLVDGAVSVAAIAKDSIGGASPVSATTVFTVDTHVPIAPTLVSPTSGQVVTTALPTITFSATSNTVSLSVTVTDSTDTASTIPASSNGDGTWSVTPATALPFGNTSVTAQATDALGGVSTASSAVSFSVCLGSGGCFACQPQSSDQFLNQCTGAQCSPFDNSTRLAGLLQTDGGLPPLP